MYNATLKILKTITDKGYEAYVVGGYPRDLYLDLNTADIDICTSATPKELKEIFKSIILPNNEYGSVTVIYRKIRFEITTYRIDIKYKNNRQPSKTKYTDDLLVDLKRRDFTINTLCMNYKGEILDLLGGKEDIENKIVRMVGNPKTRLKEDVLRILRAIRFATSLDFELEENLKKYIKKYGYLLKKLSYFRKKEELERIFSSPNASRGIKLIKELGLDKHLELTNIDKIVITSSLLGIWAQLGVLNIYSFSNYEKETIEKINKLKDLNLDNKNLFEYGLYICTIIAEYRKIDKVLINNMYNELPIKSIKEIDISAQEICEILNREPGPFIKVVYNDLKDNILDFNLENNKDKIKKYINLNKNSYKDV